jgi:carbon storage regulator
MNMLILSRRPGEEIVIDGNIRLKIIAVKRSQVRIGIRAPSQIRVDRKEVHDGRTEQDLAPPSTTEE